MSRYKNMDNVQVKSSVKDLMLWYKERWQKQKDLSYQIQTVENPDKLFLQTNDIVPSITWVGHATFLIQMRGLNVLTDPVWTKWLTTYKRLSPPGIPISDLPSIDIVLISHSHYDHLSFTTIKQLPGNPLFLVPVGLGRKFIRKGYEHVAEFEWWATCHIKGVDFTFVPAQHWTKRTLLDTNTSHWGGWIINDRLTTTVYFAGDSGYFRGFKRIGKSFDIDYALIPIGAYEPEWFMQKQHVSPEEAVEAFLDVKANFMVPMHYGSFRLADDTPKDALDRLKREWNRKKLADDTLKVLQHGETLILDVN